MNYKNKSKKRVSYKKTKRRRYNPTMKLLGGYINNSINNNVDNDMAPNEVLDEVKKEREFNLANSPILQKTGELAEGIAVKTIENIGLLLGIDLSNPQDINGNLDKIKLALADPETREKIKSIIGEISEILAIALEAAGPFIEPLMNKTFEMGTDALSQMGEAAVKIGLNTAEEIPGVGVLIGTIRSLSSAMEAFLAAANAGDEVITSSSDSINAALRNFKRLMKEKEYSLNRINNSVNNFQNNFQVPYNKYQIGNQLGNQFQAPKIPVYRGGKTQKNKLK
jgi:hypothetical protein